MKDKWTFPLCALLTAAVVFTSASCVSRHAADTQKAAPPASTELVSEEQTKPQNKTITVYVTRTGNCYHTAGCPCLERSCISISLEAAAESYRPCRRCHAPVLS